VLVVRVEQVLDLGFKWSAADARCRSESRAAAWPCLRQGARTVTAMTLGTSERESRRQHERPDPAQDERPSRRYVEVGGNRHAPVFSHGLPALRASLLPSNAGPPERLALPTLRRYALGMLVNGGWRGWVRIATGAGCVAFFGTVAGLGCGGRTSVLDIDAYGAGGSSFGAASGGSFSASGRPSGAGGKAGTGATAGRPTSRRPPRRNARSIAAATALPAPRS